MSAPRPRDYRGEVSRETANQDASRKWIRSRIDTIHQRVTAHDVLRRFGVPLRYGDGQEEQFSCPFHGQDSKPSARVYPESTRGPSHAWCFVCQERWDVLGLWKKFTGFEGKFTRLLGDIERSYGIIPPDSPPMEEETDDELASLMELFNICERNLKAYRRAFDMRSFLTLGAILDRLSTQIEDRRIPVEKARGILAQVSDKIVQKARACPGV